jgi:predicted small metal-binding protein
MQMVKFMRCRDTGMYPQCDYMIEGQSEEEIIGKVREHAKTEHGREIGDAEIAGLRKYIKEKSLSC